MNSSSKRLDALLQYADCVGNTLEHLAARDLHRGNLEAAMRYAHLAACVYSRQNRVLFSPGLETLSRKLALELPLATAREDRGSRTPDGRPKALHVLTEALPAGGLTAMATRWISADAKFTCGHVVVLDSELSVPPMLLKAVTDSGGTLHSLSDEATLVGKARRLRSLATNIADYLVLHIDVSDIVCATAFGQAGGPPVILVNHTAHTFWTGVGYADCVANCRGSLLEKYWTERHRGVLRHCTIPIPLQTDDPPPLNAAPLEVQVARRAASRLRLGIPDTATVLLTVGASFKYSPLPPLDFLSMLETILQLHRNALLLVAGFEPDARWKSAAARTGGRIRVLGRLDQDELARAHLASDIYVEGFPFGTTTALLEAVARGLAVVLPPPECPPPYSTDGIAVDGVIARASSVADWSRDLQSLIEDAEQRSRNSAQIRASVEAHHMGSGWLAYVRAAVAALPTRHGVYPIPQPVPTPQPIYSYWTICSPTWTWPFDETLEHLVLRALKLGLVPRINREARLSLGTASRQASARHMPVWLVAIFCNLILPVLPMGLRAVLFRATSFFSRPGLIQRVRGRVIRALKSTPSRGAYEEYRRPVSRSRSSGQIPVRGHNQPETLARADDPSARPAMPSDPPFFTVIIPTFNRAEFVENAIRSVMSQTYKDFELVVVDDGSTDGTSHVLKRYESVVKVIRQPNLGVSAARNAGAHASRGKWLAFLDSDDQWDEKYLEVHALYLADDEGLVFQCADCTIHDNSSPARRYFDLNGAARVLRDLSGRRMERAFSFVLQHAPWQVGAVVIRADAFRSVAGFDESLTISEDLDLLARLSTLGPARFVRQSLMTVFRLEEAVSSLSRTADRWPLRKREAHDRMYARLSTLPTLNHAERRAVLRTRSANLRALGNLIRDSGDFAAARHIFWRAFVLAPSARSFGKVCASMIRGVALATGLRKKT